MKVWAIRRKNMKGSWVFYGNDGWKPAVGNAIQFVRAGDADWICGLMDFETFVVPLYVDENGTVSMFPSVKWAVEGIPISQTMPFHTPFEIPKWQKDFEITKQMIDDLKKEMANKNQTVQADLLAYNKRSDSSDALLDRHICRLEEKVKVLEERIDNVEASDWDKGNCLACENRDKIKALGLLAKKIFEELG